MIKQLYYELCDFLQKATILRKLSINFPTCSVSRNIVVIGPLENLKLGQQVAIQNNVLFHLGGFEWCNNSGSLSIGDNAVISPNCLFYACGEEGITIGNDFDCGPGSKIFSSTVNYKIKTQHIFKEVVIGNNVLFYSNVVICPGVRIGNNSVVLAGSVVTKNIPDNHVYGGIPASFVKSI